MIVMKKHGFTLAETLLTLTIIGVCAAMMVTSIKNIDTKGKTYTIAARKAVSSFSDATKQVLLYNSKAKRMNDLYTDSSKTTACAKEACLYTLYGKYLQITKTLDSGSLPGGSTGGRLIDGVTFGLSYSKTCELSGSLYQMPVTDEAGGAVAVPVKGACAIIYYDVNGAAAPNIDGVDKFAIPVFETGVKLQSAAASTPATP